MALYTLAENCDYGGMKEEMIRDRLVVGYRDARLSQRMQLDPKLTLESAKKTLRQSEAIHDQQQVLKGATEPTNLGAIRPQCKWADRRDQLRGGRGPNRPKAGTEPKLCTRCGRGPHPRDKCPAKDAKCHNCQSKGHYSAQCLAKSVANLHDEGTLDTAFLDSVTNGQTTAWLSTIMLNGRETSFKLDTGAEVTAIFKATWEQMLGKPKLQPTDQRLFGPAHQPLHMLGHFQGHLSYKGKESIQQVFEVNHLKTKLLGLPSITTLNLADRMESTSLDQALTEEVIRITL